MTLTPVTHKTKCDVRECKCDADYVIAVKGLMGKCFICTSCLADIAKQATAITTPKSPANTIKRKMEQKSKEQKYDEK